MFSQKIVENLKRASYIRAMFEEGEKLRKIHGADKVYDFSIGNPEIDPPAAVKDALKRLVNEDRPGLHRYMSNAGFPDVKARVAEFMKKESGVELPADHIVMTCGAAGGLNVVLKSLLNPGEEVIVFSPYFVEYLFYIDNHGGKPLIVKTDAETFEPDPAELAKAITPATKAIIINTPNNPTGVIYSEDTLKKISGVLEAKEKEYNSNIFVISDEPYAKIVYDHAAVPSMMKIFKNAIVVNSFSKSLALPGERIGYIAVNSVIEDVDLLLEALIFCNRTLGFVNAPALIQKVIAESMEATVGAEYYKEKRDLLYNHLIQCGFSCLKPQGAFYLFPKALIEDDVEFVKRAMKYNLLLVPGSGFGCPGHIRLAYSVNIKTIENSLPAFTALAGEFS